MPCCDWIICEQTNRWASALRLAVERDAAAGGGGYRLREVRSLGELEAELARRPVSLAALEVRAGNLSDVLAWLAAAERRFPRARCVAILDRSLSSEHSGIGPRGGESLQEILDALREAGALEVAESPRRLNSLLELAGRHTRATAEAETITAENASFVERVRATLPWQEA